MRDNGINKLKSDACWFLVSSVQCQEAASSSALNPMCGSSFADQSVLFDAMLNEAGNVQEAVVVDVNVTWSHNLLVELQVALVVSIRGVNLEKAQISY